MSIGLTTDTAQSWAAEVAEKANIQDVSYVEKILEDEGIQGGRVLPSRRRLRLDAVHFAGVKNLVDAADADAVGAEETSEAPARRLSAFSFTQVIDSAVTAFATLGKNDAGKSTIINMILWGIRGIDTGIQADVKSWTRQAAVAFHIDSEQLLVGWRVDDGHPAGRVLSIPTEKRLSWEEMGKRGREYADRELDAARAASRAVETVHSGELDDVPKASTPSAIEVEMDRLVADGAIVVGAFSNAQSFEAVISEVMTSRLGLEPLRVWQKNKGAMDDSDGSIVTHDWSLWSQALAITDAQNSSVLGETPFMAARVLQMYLGTAWGPSASAASTRRSVLEGEITALRRRQRADEKQRQGSVDELENKIEELEEELKKLPSQDSLDEIHAALREAREAASVYADANALVLDRAKVLGFAGRQLEDAKADEEALAEAAVTRRFWHSLRPSCCPRCDAVVDEARMKREKSGHCSICDSPFESEPALADGVAEHGTSVVAVDGRDTEEDDDEDPDELLIARQRTGWLAEQLEIASSDHDVALAARDRAQLELDRTRTLVAGTRSDPAARRMVEFQIANLRGRIEERNMVVVPDEDLSTRERTIEVLAAAETIAKKRRQQEQTNMLADVSERVTELARRLGVNQLEKAELKGNAHLPVTKGGAKENFSKLTDGERLRLKIAVVVALLHVGTSAGVGRHPGVLIIDSFLREELNPDDAVGLLNELLTVAREYGLQVITSSANGALLASSLPKGSVRLAGDDGMMW